MRVINLWAGPGAGKSTTAAGLFHLFKINDHKAELVTEYAKDLVYERRDMSDQLMILAQQNRRLRRLEGTVDWVITDSPIPLGLIYVQPGSAWSEPWFANAVKAVYHQYDNVNVVLRRTKPYQGYGRNQNELEARSLDESISTLATSSSRTGIINDNGDPGSPKRLYDFLIDYDKVRGVLQEFSLG